MNKESLLKHLVSLDQVIREDMNELDLRCKLNYIINEVKDHTIVTCSCEAARCLSCGRSIGASYFYGYCENCYYNSIKEVYTKNRKIRIYLAGPMTGIDDYNFPLFHKITRELRAEGYQVFNPAEFDNADQSHRYYMIRTLMVLSIFDFDMIVLLPNWEESKGVKIEKFLADNMVNLPVILVEDFYNQHMPMEYSE